MSDNTIYSNICVFTFNTSVLFKLNINYLKLIKHGKILTLKKALYG